VNKDFLNRTLTGALIFASVALAGCGTPPAKNFSGPWKPVNQFRDQPAEIPLNPTYTFYASPMDETLKTMLTRWAKDSGRGLSYQLAFDVTLYKPVSDIRTPDIQSAAAQLNSIYAAQGVFVVANDRQILVEPASAVSPGATTRNGAPETLKPATPTNGK
jgi:hypothetical protein